MDKKTLPRTDHSKAEKILFLVVFIFLLYAVAASYYRTYVTKDYIISTEIECDPSIEKCFVYVCDPEVDGECPADEAEWTSYYKIIKKKEANIPPEINSCDPHVSECQELSCEPSELDCQIIECDPENIGKDEECSLPEEYNLENPEEAEETQECSEDDEDCVSEESEACLEGDESCISEDSENIAEESALEEPVEE